MLQNNRLSVVIRVNTTSRALKITKEFTRRSIRDNEVHPSGFEFSCAALNMHLILFLFVTHAATHLVIGLMNL